MRTLTEILDELQARHDCQFLPSTGLPELPGGLLLPDDLALFYARFSEGRVFGDPTDPRYHILAPRNFLQIGDVILGEPTPNPLQRSWHALAHVQDGNYIAIDCHPARLGCCYDAFHETIDDPSYCKIIALSFTELMNTAICAGDEAWWLEDSVGYGYADQLVD